MNQYLAVLAALLDILNRIAAALTRRNRKREQKDHEQTVQDIRDDPVAYARDQYGGVRGDADGQSGAASMPRDSPDGTDDRAERKQGLDVDAD